MKLSGIANQVLGDGKAARLSVQVLVVFFLIGIHGAESASRPMPSSSGTQPRVTPANPIPPQSRPLPKGCEVLMNGGLPSLEPVILDPRVTNLNGFAFKRPQGTGSASKLVFANGESVRLVCTGTNNHFSKLGKQVRDITVTCLSGNDFKYKTEIQRFNHFKCFEDSLSTVRNGASSSCSGRGLKLMGIGFEISRLEFVKIIDVCFNNDNLDVEWTRFDLLSEIGGQEIGFIRPEKFLDDTFGIKANNFYLGITQQSTIAKIIGDQKAAEYIKPNNKLYLSRGHLVASADFLYNIQKLATFNLINAAPQWFRFNEGNWNIAEMATRFFASSRSVDLEVYTGIHGNEMLPDSRKREHSVYLNVDKNGRKRMKAPAVYWKVVYEPRSRKGIVLVGINNQLKDLNTVMSSPGVDLCPGKHQRSDYWQICNASKASDREMGFGYCCAVGDIRTRVNFPPLTVIGILGNK